MRQQCEIKNETELEHLLIMQPIPKEGAAAGRSWPNISHSCGSRKLSQANRRRVNELCSVRAERGGARCTHWRGLSAACWPYWLKQPSIKNVSVESSYLGLNKRVQFDKYTTNSCWQLLQASIMLWGLTRWHGNIRCANEGWFTWSQVVQLDKHWHRAALAMPLAVGFNKLARPQKFCAADAKNCAESPKCCCPIKRQAASEWRVWGVSGGKVAVCRCGPAIHFILTDYISLCTPRGQMQCSGVSGSKTSCLPLTVWQALQPLQDWWPDIGFA